MILNMCIYLIKKFGLKKHQTPTFHQTQQIKISRGMEMLPEREMVQNSPVAIFGNRLQPYLIQTVTPITKSKPVRWILCLI